MTRLYNETFQCPDCGVIYAKEGLFKQWMRGHPGLLSEDGLCVFDIDFLVHKFKVPFDDKRKTRQVQCMMMVEIKTFGADLRPAQEDTMRILSMVMRNRRTNEHRKTTIRKQIGGLANKVYSSMLRREVSLRLYGVHVLQFEKTSPLNGWMKWDGKLIIEDQLVGLLNFDIDPDSMLPIDFRRHHKAKQTPLLDGVRCESWFRSSEVTTQ